jgi:putative lipoic acid-binding regulatory protein
MPRRQRFRPTLPLIAAPGRLRCAGLSSANGRVSRATNVVLGTDESEEKWRELDAQVNQYPGTRTFKAIGAGGAEFAAAMVGVVQGVVGTVHVECITSRPSSQGKYLSVTIGPVFVETPDQVIEIYRQMRLDERLKYYI